MTSLISGRPDASPLLPSLSIPLSDAATKKSRPGPASTHRPSGFFVLRTPSLPVTTMDFTPHEALAIGEGEMDEARSLEADRSLTRDVLASLLERPEVAEALHLASPSLEASLTQWRRDPESDKGQASERALVRYLLRMAGRATPFGLFAGCSLGKVGDRTCLQVSSLKQGIRRTRLDGDYLSSLAHSLGGSREVRAHLTVRPHSGLYRAAGALRFAETQWKGRSRSYHLVAVNPSEAIDALLDSCREGTTPAHLAEALARRLPGIDGEEARAFVELAVEHQLLVSDHEPPVTGVSGLEHILEMLHQGKEEHPHREALERVRDSLIRMDQRGVGQPPATYHQLHQELLPLPVEADPARLFQVDLWKPGESTLGPQVMNEILAGVALLHRLTPRRPDPFQRFKEAFRARYEEREVPLLEVLDEEHGIGFESAPQTLSQGGPLLQGLPLGLETRGAPSWESRHGVLLRLLERVAQRGDRHLRLTEEDLVSLTPQVSEAPLPDALQVMVAVAATSEDACDSGNFQIHLQGGSGPSGAALLGRFCHLNEELEAQVKAHLREEEALRPEAVFAEVVHLPQGRLGNILRRPVLREHEIPFLGRSGAPLDKQIPPQDLVIAVEGDRVVLKSLRLGREVIPRLTSAYAWRHPTSQGVHRFLCTLQEQGITRDLFFDWGPLEDAAFLPRVTFGRLVLFLARWKVGSDPSWTGKEGPLARCQAIQSVRKSLNLPRHVALTEMDNVLPLDLDNSLCVDVLFHALRQRSEVVLTEVFPGRDQLLAGEEGGPLVHEIILPLVKRTHDATGKEPVQSPISLSHRGRGGGSSRVFAPGSEWLYFRLLASPAAADSVLVDLVSQVASRAETSGAASQWFFLRYGDPRWHLRFRLHGDPSRLCSQVLPDLHRLATPLLADGRLQGIELGTYEQEEERYGGLQGMKASEAWFHADSQAVMALLPPLLGDAGAEARWRVTLQGLDALMRDLGWDLPGRLRLAEGLRGGLAGEFSGGSPLEKSLSARYRGEREGVESILLGEVKGVPIHAFAEGIFANRRLEGGKVLAELQELHRSGQLQTSWEALSASLLHMFANRMLRAAGRAQEFVLYDFMARGYASLLARRRGMERVRPPEPILPLSL